jgi:drug/metabolite transporter (DMT)-like permease
MDKETRNQQLKLHIIVFILGFTAILGKLIEIPALPLVWYRTMIATLTLLAMLMIARKGLRLPWKVVLQLAGIGLVVAAHWISFFHAIKVSNIAVTLSCLSATTLFTSFIEPLSQKRRVSWLEVVIGAVIIGAIYLIYQFETHYLEGIVFAILAALLASLFSVLNKNIALKYDIRAIACWEMLSGFIGVSLFMLITRSPGDWQLALTWKDAIWLLLLGTVCTAIAFAETIRIMKKLSAYLVVLAINLEPVYGIILAFIIFGESERMTTGFYCGTLVLLAAVFMYPVLKRRLRI